MNVRRAFWPHKQDKTEYGRFCNVIMDAEGKKNDEPKRQGWQIRTWVVFFLVPFIALVTGVSMLPEATEEVYIISKDWIIVDRVVALVIGAMVGLTMIFSAQRVDWTYAHRTREWYKRVYKRVRGVTHSYPSDPPRGLAAVEEEVSRLWEEIRVGEGSATNKKLSAKVDKLMAEVKKLNKIKPSKLEVSEEHIGYSPSLVHPGASSSVFHPQSHTRKPR